jgi:hypothetical protein
MVGFWYPKCGLKQLEKMWREQGLLDSRPLHKIKAGKSSGLKLPRGLGFYIAPSNNQAYFANHFKMLGPAPNAEFTDHWATRDNELVPTFTFRMMATRNLIANEQILVDYGSDFAALEPYQDESEEAPPEGQEKPRTRKRKLKLDSSSSNNSKPSSGPMPNTPPRTAPADGD